MISYQDFLNKNTELLSESVQTFKTKLNTLQDALDNDDGDFDSQRKINNAIYDTQMEMSKVIVSVLKELSEIDFRDLTDAIKLISNKEAGKVAFSDTKELTSKINEFKKNYNEFKEYLKEYQDNIFG